jgi:hypothetical protein
MEEASEIVLAPLATGTLDPLTERTNPELVSPLAVPVSV